MVWGQLIMTIKSVVWAAVLLALSASSIAQNAKPSTDAKPGSPTAESDSKAYSGMYTFLKEGEFVQITVEDEGHVTGFISRYGDGESDKGAFLDQFFKTGNLDGKRLSFTTVLVHGVSYEFKGAIDRGDGKSPGDDAYFVLKGTLTENVTDVNKKVTAQSREVVFKMFPQDASPAPAARN
jgi:hypothetical protein